MHRDDPDPDQEMRFLTGRLKEKDEENETESDWKFAAMVIDRWEYDMYNRWELIISLSSCTWFGK